MRLEPRKDLRGSGSSRMSSERSWLRCYYPRRGRVTHVPTIGRPSTASSMYWSGGVAGRTCLLTTEAARPAGTGCAAGSGKGCGTGFGRPSWVLWTSSSVWTGSTPCGTVARCRPKRGAQSRLLGPAPGEGDQAAPGRGWQRGAPGLASDGCPGARQPGRLLHPETPAGRAEATSPGPGCRQRVRQPPSAASLTTAGHPCQHPRTALPAPKEAREATQAAHGPRCPSLGGGADLRLAEQCLPPPAGPLREAGFGVPSIVRPWLCHPLPNPGFQMSSKSLHRRRRLYENSFLWPLDCCCCRRHNQGYPLASQPYRKCPLSRR
jgi:hypothetical protein